MSNRGEAFRALVWGLLYLFVSLAGLRSVHSHGAKGAFLLLGVVLLFAQGLLMLLLALLALLRADEELIAISLTLGALTFLVFLVLGFGGLGFPLVIAGETLPARLAGVLFSLAALFVLYRVKFALRRLVTQIRALLRQ